LSPRARAEGLNRAWVGLLWKFPLHQLAGTVGAGFLAAALTFLALPPDRANTILVLGHTFPVQILVAFALGAVLSLVFAPRAAEWVWVLPAILLLIPFIESGMPFEARLQVFFGTACSPAEHCMAQLGATLPFYMGSAYSTAAFITRNIKTVVRRPARVG